MFLSLSQKKNHHLTQKCPSNAWAPKLPYVHLSSLSHPPSLLHTHEQAAGITFKKDGESARQCLTFKNRPSTPTNIQKYRKSCFGPGQRRIHYGTYDDAKIFEKNREKLSKSKRTFGVSSAGSLHVEDVFSQGPQTSMQDTLNANLERHYKSRQNTLGKGKSHGHKLPSHVSTSEFRFGKVDPKKSETAIKAIFPESRYENSKEDIERYKKSHAAFAPGRACRISGDVDNFARCSVVKFREVVDDLENTRDSSSRNPNWWTEASLWADKRL